MGKRLILAALALSALPLMAQKSERRVVAPCELTTVSAVASGRERAGEGREYVLRVTNHSNRTVAMPQTPAFGWRVDVMERPARHGILPGKGEWRRKSEGGPVRPVSASDPHLMVVGGWDHSALVEIAPAASKDFALFLPEADRAVNAETNPAIMKLTLYWAAPAELGRKEHSALPCGLLAEWVASIVPKPN